MPKPLNHTILMESMLASQLHDLVLFLVFDETDGAIIVLFFFFKGYHWESAYLL